jgi:carbonic anhydrase
MHTHAEPPVPPEESLRRLVEGNRRFTDGTPLNNQVSLDRLTHLSEGQRPFAIVLGCSDSRVPPELLFDQGFGDLFVIRLAGNVIAPGVFGSIQYAHLHLGTSLLVVLGHDGCGAVAAALASRFHEAEHPERIRQVLELIEPGLAGVDPALAAEHRLRAAVEANVRWSLRQVRESPEARRAFAEQRRVMLVGAVYELTTGRVRWLDTVSPERTATIDAKPARVRNRKERS